MRVGKMGRLTKGREAAEKKKKAVLSKRRQKNACKEDRAIKKADKRREICFSQSLYEREII